MDLRARKRRRAAALQDASALSHDNMSSIAQNAFTIPSATDRIVWLRVGTLLDGTSTRPRQNAHVVYGRNGFLFVGDTSDSPPQDLLNPGQREPDADLPDHILFPGLI